MIFLLTLHYRRQDSVIHENTPTARGIGHSWESSRELSVWWVSLNWQYWFLYFPNDDVAVASRHKTPTENAGSKNICFVLISPDQEVWESFLKKNLIKILIVIPLEVQSLTKSLKSLASHDPSTNKVFYHHLADPSQYSVPVALSCIHLGNG